MSTPTFHDAGAELAAGHAAFLDRSGIYRIEHPTEGAIGPDNPQCALRDRR